MELILASTSPYRRDLLGRLGLRFRCIAPTVDEEALKDDALEAVALSEKLATAKGQSIAVTHPGAVVIGSDQLVAFEGRVLGKPGTTGRAVAQLLAMAGKTHQLVTSVCVADSSGVELHTEVATLTLRTLDLAEATRYVEADRPLDCAGSYRIEGLGIVLFERIEAGDQTAIIGLPLMAVCRMLRARGFVLP